jgi:hypothetical protein
VHISLTTFQVYQSLILVLQLVTYAFDIYIRRDTNLNIPVVAYYNISLACNYIPGPFSRELRYESDSNLIISLDWECKGLGRYQERTLFAIGRSSHGCMKMLTSCIPIVESRRLLRYQ